MQPRTAEDAAVTGSDDESLGIHSLVFLQRENSQRERKRKREGARKEISLLTDIKEQPLEHEVLGQGDPGLERAGCRGHLKWKLQGQRDVALMGGFAGGVLVTRLLLVLTWSGHPGPEHN